jgi:putative solute:sodium symporter small subunit
MVASRKTSGPPWPGSFRRNDPKYAKEASHGHQRKHAHDAPSGDAARTGNDARMRRYWQRNLRYMVVLLGIWFVAGYVLSIFFVNQLNAVHVAGFPLGFWFAQQGSMYVFVLLILAYFLLMDRLDRRFDVHE